MPEAMEIIRREMGSDAMIVSTRKLRAKGLAGWFGKMTYEVVAAIEQAPDQPVTKEAPSSSPARVPEPARVSGQGKPAPNAALGVPSSRPAQAVADGRREFGHLVTEVVAESLPSLPRVQAAARYEAAATARLMPVLDPPAAPCLESLPRTASRERSQGEVASPAFAGPAVSLRSQGQTASAAEQTPSPSSLMTPPSVVPPPPPPAPETGKPVDQQLQEIRSLLSVLMSESAVARLDGVEQAWLREASASGLSEALCQRFIAESLLADPQGERASQIADSVRRLVESVLAPRSPGRTLRADDRLVGLIGPTGVGKTTTIAKLAARARVKEGRNVGLLTIDTFRVAAVEQLRTYAEILSIPVVAARDASEVALGMQALSDCDLVLVDTTGRSFLTSEQAHDMCATLAGLTFDVQYLVISLSMRLSEALQVAKTLSAVQYDALLFTKSDEALRPSLALSLLDALCLPFSYVTTGQQVPDDVVVPDAEWFVRHLTRGVHDG